MTPGQRRAVLADGTRTAVLATTRADGRPHAVPVWFALDDEDVLINTSEDSVTGRAPQRDPRVTVVAGDEAPPYAFVMGEGVAEMSRDAEDIRWGTAEIARRYLGGGGSEEFLRYATGPGEVFFRVRRAHVVAQARIAG